MSKSWHIAGRRVTTPAATEYFLSIYPHLTLKHYDNGGPSPRDRVTMADLGRATLFGAFRGWKAASNLLEASTRAEWPTEATDWHLVDGDLTDGSEWLSLPEVQAARSLFAALASGRDGGWREAATSKVLHLKWPSFFPIIDGELRRLYADRAMAHQRAMPGNRRRKHATTMAYWLAVREDLRRPANVEADRETRNEVTQRADRSDGDVRAQAELIGQLTRLRMMDALAWAIETGDLEATQPRL